MTYEEAARILDPETSREALLPYAYDPQYQQMLLRDACQMAAEVLRCAVDTNAGDKWESAKDNPPKESGEYIVGCNRPGERKVKQMSKIMSISPCFDCWLRYSSYCMTCEWWEVGIGLRED